MGFLLSAEFAIPANETAEIMDDSAVQSMLDGFSSENTSVTTIGIGSPRASTEANYALRCLVDVMPNFHPVYLRPLHIFPAHLMKLPNRHMHCYVPG